MGILAEVIAKKLPEREFSRFASGQEGAVGQGLSNVGNPALTGPSPNQVGRQHLFRFVRHLPAQRQGAAHGTGLRAGVGQTSGEETAGRTAMVLDAARAGKLRSGDNPARWKGHLSLLLPKPRKVTPVKHHPALPFSEAPRFMSELRTHSGMSALCLQLVMLTAVRSGEALKARWTEFDRTSGLWNIPASRTKTGKEHRVPLSADALTVLENAAAMRQNEYVFPGVKSGKPMSDMALTMLVRGMRPGITVHGFRSTFRDWVAEKTSYANELVEMALGHAIGGAVEADYRRGDMFERRRQLMNDWAQWCMPS